MSKLVRGSILIGWFFAVMSGQSAVILGPFKTRFHCELEAWEVKQLIHRGLVVRAAATTECWEGWGDVES